MKREWNVLNGEAGSVPGDEAAQARAVALAQIADAGLIDTLIDAIVLMRRIGGQVYLAAHRAKFDADGAMVSDRDTPGRWETVGYLAHYEHRDHRLEVAKPPKLPELEDVVAEVEATDTLEGISDEEVEQLREALAEPEPVAVADEDAE